MTTSNASTRLPHVVPSLRRLAAPAAFTLVEMVVAMALATVIVLCAFTCFRMITKAIAQANQVSQENALLRTGFFLAEQDIDYWHSYADMRSPWKKQWTRIPAQETPTSVGSNAFRHIFQPIRFCPRTDTSERDPSPGTRASGLDYSWYNAASPTYSDYNSPWSLSNGYWIDPYNRNDIVPNPNCMLAADTRSVARVPLQPMRIPEYQEGGDWETYNDNWGVPRLHMGDYTLVDAADGRDPPNATNPHWPTGLGIKIPLDYTPGQAATASYPDNGTIDIPIDPGICMYQPCLWASIYARLSFVGLYQYMTPGTPVFWNDSSGLIFDYFTRPIPPAITYMVTDPTPTLSMTEDRDYNINDRAIGANQDVSTRMGDILTATSGTRVTCGNAFIPVWPQSYLITWQGEAAIGDWNGFADYMEQNFPYEQLMGNAGSEGTASDFQFDMAANTMVMEYLRGDVARQDVNNTATTVWLPYNLTDVDRSDPDTGTAAFPLNIQRTTLGNYDYSSKPANLPSLVTSILRYGRAGGGEDFVIARVAVNSPDGHRIELPMSPVGTSFRGARQHYRLYSKGIGSATTPIAYHGARFAYPPFTCIGDFYDEADGPYYVANSTNNY